MINNSDAGFVKRFKELVISEPVNKHTKEEIKESEKEKVVVKQFKPKGVVENPESGSAPVVPKTVM